MHRDLLYAVDAPLFDAIAGSTDSEALFYLALTFGLQDDPLGAVERAVGFVEATGRDRGIENPVQMTLGFSDGEPLYSVRYSTEASFAHPVRVRDVASLRALHPGNARLQQMSDEDRIVVSEPVSDLPGGVARGARVHRADHPARARRAAGVQPAATVECPRRATTITNRKPRSRLSMKGVAVSDEQFEEMGPIDYMVLEWAGTSTGR